MLARYQTSDVDMEGTKIKHLQITEIKIPQITSENVFYKLQIFVMLSII